MGGIGSITQYFTFRGTIRLGNRLDFFHLFTHGIFFLRFYLFIRDRERQRHRQREKQAPHKKPDAELDPRTLGSGPKSKADAQPLSHPGVPAFLFLDIALKE